MGGLTEIATELVILGASALLAWKTHLLVSRGPCEPAASKAALHRWAALGAVRLWEAAAEPVAQWAPFYSETKLLLLLWFLASDGGSFASLVARTLSPTTESIARFAQRTAAPALARRAASTGVEAQLAVLRLLAPALPAEELRAWEASLLGQAAEADARSSGALESAAASAPLPAPACEVQPEGDRAAPAAAAVELDDAAPGHPAAEQDCLAGGPSEAGSHLPEERDNGVEEEAEGEEEEEEGCAAAADGGSVGGDGLDTSQEPVTPQPGSVLRQRQAPAGAASPSMSPSLSPSMSPSLSPIGEL
ncbi:hypothetical protein FNF29_05486 [Cafeteria roenbergensis]|uniref:Uncharacterized protein n=1 Tax=Cafeteria roenbergensis TaxID=33653 RepID=A0A5A8CAU0_CAFRO|nr:hypothetical protein FNF29_05486 [Cafeteria roenbergensis]|eukprot:KAA0150045.1 hypothetical protein FNF29_05486 [Cafeteria roenbergensis]